MKVGILGAGTMGNGIAHVFALHQYKVVLVDINDKILNIALNNIRTNLSRQIKKKIIDQKKLDNALNNIEISTNIDSFKFCDLVIEAIKEDLELKKSVFKKLDFICNKETILASNTSSISINDLANSTKTPERVIGMHFMNPVPIMKLVEIINGKETSKNTTTAIIKLSNDLDKIPVCCNDSPGFVSNRILMPMINEAAHCFNEGVANAESIDSIMKLGMGHPMGPLKLADLIGIDICVMILQVLYDGFNDEKYKPSNILIDLVNNNKLGKKTGEGFYKYEL